MPNPLDPNAASGFERGATLQEMLMDAHGRELNRRTEGMGTEEALATTERLPFNSFVDEQRRAFESSGDAANAKLLQDFQQNKAISLGAQRREDEQLAVGEAAGAVSSGLLLGAEKLTPFGDGGISREERLENVREGTSILRDAEQLGFKAASSFTDAASLGAIPALTQAIIQDKASRGDLPTIGEGPSPLQGMDANTILRRGEAAFNEQMDNNGIPRWMQGTAGGVGDLAALIIGTGMLSRAGNVLKAKGAAIPGMKIFGRALQNPMVNMAAYAGIQNEGQIMSARLMGETERADQLSEGRGATMLNAAVFGAIMPGAQFAGNAIQRGLLKVVATPAQRAAWFGKTMKELPNLWAKGVTGATHVGGKIGEFGSLAFAPAPYRQGQDGKQELTPWVTTILNPLKISEQLKGENGDWVEALAQIYEEGLGHIQEEAALGGLLGLATLGKARGGTKFTEPLRSPLKLGPKGSTDPKQQAEAIAKFQKDARVSAKQALTRAERKALREGIRTEWANVKDKPEQMQAIINYVLAGAEMRGRLMKRHGLIDPKTPTVIEMYRRHMEEVIGPEIFDGRLKDTTAPGTGVTGRFVADPDHPNQPGRTFEVLSSQDAAEKLSGGREGPGQATRILRVRFEDGTVGVVPEASVRLDAELKGNREAREAREAEEAKATAQAGPGGTGKGEGEAARKRGTQGGGFGLVRDTKTGQEGELVRSHLGEDGQRLIDVRIAGELRTFAADRFEISEPRQRLQETEIGRVPGSGTGQPDTTRQQRTEQRVERGEVENKSIDAGADRIGEKGGKSLLDRIRRRFKLNEHEGLHQVERQAEAGRMEAADLAEHQRQVVDTYYAPDQPIQRGRGGNTLAAYRSLRRRFLAGKGNTGPRKVLGRLKATWDAMSEGQRKAALGEDPSRLPHEQAGKGLDLVQRAIKGVENRFLGEAPEAPAREPKGRVPKAPEGPSKPSEPVPDKAPTGKDAGEEAPTEPTGAPKEPQESRRFGDTEAKEGETPAERRLRRLRTVAAKRKQQAFTDADTGAPNSRARKKATPRIDADPDQGWVVFDLRKFKALNDALGQVEGDAAIKKAIERLQVLAKEAGISDRLVFREGGDEFAVGGEKGALERLRELAANEVLEHKGKETGFHTPEIGETFADAAENLKNIKKDTGRKAPPAEGEAAPEAPEAPEVAPKINGTARGGIPTRPAPDVQPDPTAREKPAPTPGFDPEKAKAFQPAGIKRIIARMEAGRLNETDGEAALKDAQDALSSAEKDLADARRNNRSTGRAVQVVAGLKKAIPGLKKAIADARAKTAPAPDVVVKPGVVVKPPEGTEAASNAPERAPAEITESGQYAEGRSTSIPQEGTKERIPARYVLVPSESLLPSHNAGERFKPNEQYPEGLQPRDYENDSGEQSKVERIIRDFNPEELINTNPRADAGPPTAAFDSKSGKYVIVNGNGRTMGMLEALKNPEHFEAYSRLLESSQGQFGFDTLDSPGAAGGVLVRVADIGARGTKAAEFARRGNVPGGLRQKPVDRAAAEVGLLTDTVLSELNADADTTVSQAVNGPAGAKFRDTLRKKLGTAGNDLFNEDGSLTDTGREFVDSMLTMKAGFSKDEISSLTPKMQQSVAASTMQFLQMEQNPKTAEEAQLLRNALSFVGRNLEGGRLSLAEFEAQGSMFGERPPMSMEERAAIVGLRQVAQKPRKMREALAELVQRDTDAPGQGTFLDVSPRPFIERLSDAFGLEISDGAISIAQDAKTGEKVGFPSMEERSRHDELTNTERENMAAPDPIDTRDSIGGLNIPLSERPAGEWSGKTAARRDIVGAIEKLFSVPIRVGRSRAFNQGVLGWFNTRTRAIRLKNANDIVVATHEVGHSLEKVVWPQMRGHSEFLEMRAEMERAGEALYGPKEPHNGYMSEGFAEFMRLYTTRPALAKQHLPKTLRWFDENFAPKNKNFKSQLKDVRQMVDDFVKQGDENRILSAIVKGKITPSKFEKTLNFFSKDKWWDELTPIERLVKFAERNGNVNLDPQADPFKLADALRNTHNARAEYMAETGMIDPSGRIVGPALADAVSVIEASAKRRGVTRDSALDQFGAYLVSKRTLELGRRGIRSGNLDLRDARTFIERMEVENPEYLVAGKQVWDWNRSVLTYAKQLGAITTADYNAVLARNRFYVPFVRVHPGEVPGGLSGPGGGSTKRNPLQRIGGSDADIRDPFPMMVSNAAGILRFSHRRAVMQRIAMLADTTGGISSMIQLVDRDVLKKVKPLEDFKKQLEDAGADLEDADLGALLTWYEPKTRPDSKSPIVPIVKADGKLKWYEVDRQLWDALEGMDPYRLPGAFDLFLGAPARMKRLGTTGLRASFSLVTNPIRDYATMMFQSTSNNPLEIAGQWAKAQGHSVKRLFGKDAHYGDLWEGVRNGTFTMPQAVKQAQQRQGVPGVVRAAGVEISQPLGQDLARTFRLGEHLGRSRAGRVAADLKKGRVLSAGSDFLDLMRDVFQIPEAGPRIAEANIVAKRIGYKPGEPISFRQAMNAMVQMKQGASQVTVDFNAAGRYARIVNAAVPFFNVAIQGPRSFARAYKRNPVFASAMGLGVTAMTLALWKQNRDEDWWIDMPWREKFAYWHIQVGDDRVRIPRPFEPGLSFAVMPEAIMDSMYREDPETVKEGIDHAYETLLPDFLPVLFKEGMEQLQNEDDFRDSPIVPGGETRLPAEEQFGSSTSVAARKLGKIFGWSPRRIDHAINGIFGGVGTDVARAAGVVKERDRERQISDLPVVGRLFAHDGAEGFSSQAVQDFFDLRANLQKRGASKANPASPREKASLRILERASRRLKRVRERKVEERSVEGRNAALREMREIARTSMDRVQQLLELDEQ